MWRLALVLAACSSAPSVEPPEPPAQHAVDPSPLPPAASVPAVAAIHVDAIVTVALTEDGLSAATADASGAVRLWPTLDGTREPYVVAAPAARQVAIARAGDFKLAVVDQAGSLEIVRVTGGGQVLGRTQVGGDQPVAEIIATTEGFLVEHVDQTIELVAFDGAHAGTLSPPRRVASLLYRRGRALVLFEVGGARWIDLAGGLRWGGETRPFAIDPRRAALSPDHRHLAAAVTTAAKPSIVVIDLVTGTAGLPMTGKGEPLGYTDANELVCGDGFKLLWWTEAGVPLVRRYLGLRFDAAPLAFTDHRLVTGEGQSLHLIDREHEGFLGYDVGVPVLMYGASAGVSVMFEGQLWAVDVGLHRGRMVPSPAHDAAAILDAVAIDDHTTLALEHAGEGKTWVTIVGGQMVIPTVVDVNTRLHYEPSTRLIAVTNSGTDTFVRLGADGRAGPPMRLSTSSVPISPETDRSDDVFLLDPALANGLVALVIRDDHVFELHRDDLVGTELHARRMYPFGGWGSEIRAVDLAGRLYTPIESAIVVHAGRSRVVLHGVEDHARVIPTGDGALIAVLGRNQLSLYAGDGTLRWSVSALGVTSVAWDGRALIGDAQGLVRFDLVTGEIVDRQCGMHFGRFETAPAFHSSARLACDAP